MKKLFQCCLISLDLLKCTTEFPEVSAAQKNDPSCFYFDWYRKVIKINSHDHSDYPNGHLTFKFLFKQRIGKKLKSGNHLDPWKWSHELTEMIFLSIFFFFRNRLFYSSIPVITNNSSKSRLALPHMKDYSFVMHGNSNPDLELLFVVTGMEL